MLETFYRSTLSIIISHTGPTPNILIDAPVWTSLFRTIWLNLIVEAFN